MDTWSKCEEKLSVLSKNFSKGRTASSGFSDLPAQTKVYVCENAAVARPISFISPPMVALYGLTDPTVTLVRPPSWFAQHPNSFTGLLKRPTANLVGLNVSDVKSPFDILDESVNDPRGFPLAYALSGCVTPLGRLLFFNGFVEGIANHFYNHSALLPVGDLTALVTGLSSFCKPAISFVAPVDSKAASPTERSFDASLVETLVNLFPFFLRDANATQTFRPDFCMELEAVAAFLAPLSKFVCKMIAREPFHDDVSPSPGLHALMEAYALLPSALLAVAPYHFFLARRAHTSSSNPKSVYPGVLPLFHRLSGSEDWVQLENVTIDDGFGLLLAARSLPVPKGHDKRMGKIGYILAFTSTLLPNRSTVLFGSPSTPKTDLQLAPFTRALSLPPQLLVLDSDEGSTLELLDILVLSRFCFPCGSCRHEETAKDTCISTSCPTANREVVDGLLKTTIARRQQALNKRDTVPLPAMAMLAKMCKAEDLFSSKRRTPPTARSLAEDFDAFTSAGFLWDTSSHSTPQSDEVAVLAQKATKSIPALTKAEERTAAEKERLAREGKLKEKAYASLVKSTRTVPPDEEGKSE
jgi:hypothetical protein